MKLASLLIISASIAFAGSEVHADPYLSTEFRAYQWNQPPQVPTADGTQIPGAFALPVYADVAPRQYEIIGMVYVHVDPRVAQPDDARMRAARSAVTAARSHGAQAVILQETNEGIRAWLNSGREGLPVFMIATAIKWK